MAGYPTSETFVVKGISFASHKYASEQCPVFPGAVKRIHHNFPDPAKARGTEEELMNALRSVRDEIKSFCKTLI